MPSYSEFNFYCEASDKRGHSHQIRIPPDIHGHLSAILSDTTLPYKTFQDFVRDALVHRCHFLEENKDNEQIKSESKRLLAQATLDRQSRVVAAERAVVDSLRQAVNDPERRVQLTREQIEDAISSISLTSLRDEAERAVSGISLA